MNLKIFCSVKSIATGIINTVLKAIVRFGNELLEDRKHRKGI